jgi:hypothetical protein
VRPLEREAGNVPDQWDGRPAGYVTSVTIITAIAVTIITATSVTIITAPISRGSYPCCLRGRMRHVKSMGISCEGQAV